MYLSRHQTPHGARWACAGQWLPAGLRLGFLLSLSRPHLAEMLPALAGAAAGGETAGGPILPPSEPEQEVWAAGVTYQRSREARRAESEVADVYDRVYTAERPELFFKSVGWRVAGQGDTLRLRADSHWNVPEPELTLVVNAHGEIVGYTAGNDMSSRSIEGENPLYLPQAKIYTGACALGPGLELLPAAPLDSLAISLTIERQGVTVFEGETSTARLNRPLEHLVRYLYRELSFPHGVFLMTGTGIVPPAAFTLQPGDRVGIRVGELELHNVVSA
jgi:2-dehydro-3-deoxy-D-arabinonate dehydratase